jgi:predicted ribosomally synthesized peptide with SipW-like signal peptide
LKRSILLSTLAIAAALTLLAVAGTQALFTDSQTATGDVNAGTLDLYLLEPSGDDSAGDEVIFEGAENLLPGQTANYTLRISNVGTAAITIAALDFSGSSGGECDADNVGDEFIPSIAGVLVGDTIPAGAFVDATVSVQLLAAADNDCQGDTFTAVLDVDVTS